MGSLGRHHWLPVNPIASERQITMPVPRTTEHACTFPAYHRLPFASSWWHARNSESLATTTLCHLCTCTAELYECCLVGGPPTFWGSPKIARPMHLLPVVDVWWYVPRALGILLCLCVPLVFHAYVPGVVDGCSCGLASRQEPVNLWKKLSRLSSIP